SLYLLQCKKIQTQKNFGKINKIIIQKLEDLKILMFINFNHNKKIIPLQNQDIILNLNKNYIKKISYLHLQDKNLVNIVQIILSKKKVYLLIHILEKLVYHQYIQKNIIMFFFTRINDFLLNQNQFFQKISCSII
ncbi:hypothetical protein IMG5_109250, partial [Ichthyophthirius multifiliis]